MQVGKPLQLRGKLLFQHEAVMIVPTEGAPKKNNHLVRPRHDRVLQRMLFFFRCNAPVASHHRATDDTPVHIPPNLERVAIAYMAHCAYSPGYETLLSRPS